MIFLKCQNSVCQQGRMGAIGAIAPTYFEVNPIAPMIFMEYVSSWFPEFALQDLKEGKNLHLQPSIPNEASGKEVVEGLISVRDDPNREIMTIRFSFSTRGRFSKHILNVKYNQSRVIFQEMMEDVVRQAKLGDLQRTIATILTFFIRDVKVILLLVFRIRTGTNKRAR